MQRISAPRTPPPLRPQKRKLEATEADERAAARKVKILQYMDPQRNRTAKPRSVEPTSGLMRIAEHSTVNTSGILFSVSRTSSLLPLNPSPRTPRRQRFPAKRPRLYTRRRPSPISSKQYLTPRLSSRKTFAPRRVHLYRWHLSVQHHKLQQLQRHRQRTVRSHLARRLLCPTTLPHRPLRLPKSYTQPPRRDPHHRRHQCNPTSSRLSSRGCNRSRS